MKTCKKDHEYDGGLFDRCPECRRIANRNIYLRNAEKIAAKHKANKEALARVPELEAQIAKLLKEKVR